MRCGLTHRQHYCFNTVAPACPQERYHKLRTCAATSLLRMCCGHIDAR
jgi:hypothetical protein